MSPHRILSPRSYSIFSSTSERLWRDRNFPEGFEGLGYDLGEPIRFAHSRA